MSCRCGRVNLVPGSKQVLVDFSNQNQFDCFGGLKIDMPDSFNQTFGQHFSE